MRLFRDRSIETKLRILTAAAVVVALGLACTAFVVAHVHRVRASKVRQLSTLAKVLGCNTTAALDFQDNDAAAELLSSLREQPTVQLACLYDAQGSPFATYPRELPQTMAIPPVPPPGGTTFTADGYLEVVHEIRRPDETVGVLLLRAGMQDLRAQLIQYAWIVVGAAVGALVVSVLLTSRLQRLITTPILRLFNVMKRISREDDYSLRVEEFGQDELGILCRGFNAMLGRIEQTRDELQQAHDQLEDRVARRTAELSQTNQDLKDAIIAAEAASRAKSNFLANMSHEIRTPMTAILGYIDLLMEQDTTETERREYVETICRNSEGLLRIIDDILDISKIEAGRMTVEKMALSPAAIVAEVASLMRPRATSKNLSLDVEHCGDVPQTIHSDPTRLRQILTNLVGNAIKFTEAGGVRIVVRMVDPADAPNPLIGFEVIDTGVGMEPEQVEGVFQAFSQADGSMTRRFGGTGLGLTISKHLASMLGGDISVESRPGEGSRFLATVAAGPLQGVQMLDPSGATLEASQRPAAGTAREGVAGEMAQPGGRILLAEDGPDNQRFISFVLRKSGAEVAVVDNGRQAVDEALQASEAGRPFDVILMDMQMPVMDGYHATGKLRAAGYTGSIIALTAHAMSQDRQKCIDAGCDGYITKPIDREKLLQLMGEYTQSQVGESTSAEGVRPDLSHSVPPGPDSS